MADDEISFDFKNITKYSKKYSKHMGLVLLLLIPIILSIFLRIQPAYLPITDDWAQRSIESNIKANIEQQLAVQYPNLPVENRNKIVNDEFRKVVSGGTLDYNGQSVDIQEVIEQNSQYLKDKFQNSAGTTYLLAIDPYYFYRHTQNALETGNEWGYVLDEEKGLYLDHLNLAGLPLDKRNPQTVAIKNFHVWLQVKLTIKKRIYLNIKK